MFTNKIYKENKENLGETKKQRQQINDDSCASY